MAIFSVLEAPDESEDRTVFVKEGYAPWAFVFTVLWALWHRMWVVAAVLFAILAAISLCVAAGILEGALGGLIQFAIALIFGFEARRLYMISLQRAGYRAAGIVECSSREAAELDYFSQRTRSPSRQARRSFHPYSEDMLNLFGDA